MDKMKAEVSGYFVPRFREVLYEKGMKQKELARRIGCTEAAMSRWIKGNRLPSLELFVRIAKETGTSTDWLLGLDLKTLGKEKAKASLADAIEVIEEAIKTIKIEEAER